MPARIERARFETARSMLIAGLGQRYSGREKQSTYKAADAPNFERYGPESDPRSGNGGLEIWIPMKS